MDFIDEKTLEDLLKKPLELGIGIHKHFIEEMKKRINEINKIIKNVVEKSDKNKKESIISEMKEVIKVLSSIVYALGTKINTEIEEELGATSSVLGTSYFDNFKEYILDNNNKDLLGKYHEEAVEIGKIMLEVLGISNRKEFKDIVISISRKEGSLLPPEAYALFKDTFKEYHEKNKGDIIKPEKSSVQYPPQKIAQEQPSKEKAPEEGRISKDTITQEPKDSKFSKKARKIEEKLERILESRVGGGASTPGQGGMVDKRTTYTTETQKTLQSQQVLQAIPKSPEDVQEIWKELREIEKKLEKLDNYQKKLRELENKIDSYQENIQGMLKNILNILNELRPFIYNTLKKTSDLEHPRAEVQKTLLDSEKFLEHFLGNNLYKDLIKDSEKYANNPDLRLAYFFIAAVLKKDEKAKKIFDQIGDENRVFKKMLEVLSKEGIEDSKKRILIKLIKSFYSISE